MPKCKQCGEDVRPGAKLDKEAPGVYRLARADHDDVIVVHDCRSSQ